jgi:hypothetical protein
MTAIAVGLKVMAEIVAPLQGLVTAMVTATLLGVKLTLV